MNMLKLRKILKGYNSKYIIFNINFDINENDFIILKGKSGSGKSTLLNILSGLDRDFTGQVLFDNNDIAKLTTKQKNDLYRKNIGIIHQGFYLNPNLTIAKNIELSGIFANLNKKIRKHRIDMLAKAFGIEHVLKQKPNEISGGEAERACVARAIFMNPKLIIADEPTNNLDAENIENLMHILQAIQKNSGAAIIVASHDEKIDKFANRIIELKEGQLYENI